MIHAICGFTELHRMKISIQGCNQGTISEVYTRYSFNVGSKYEETRHQICVKDDGKQYGVFKGIANAELVCENRMIIHIVPEKEEDFDTIYQALLAPKKYPSLGRYEDLLDIEKVDVVNISQVDEAEPEMYIYIPIHYFEDAQVSLATVYTLTKEYEITKKGLRRWKKDGGKIKVYYCPKGETVYDVYVDDYEGGSTVVALA